MKKNMYLPMHSVSVSNSGECIQLINEAFKLNAPPFFTNRASTVNSLLFFAYMCQYITYEELEMFLGPYFTSPRIRMAVSSLIEKKLLRKEKFLPNEGLSRYAFCLTRAGINHILPMLPSHLTKTIKPRRSGKVVPIHDYYCGMNLLHFMLAGYVFTWEKETIISGRLRPDIILHMYVKDIPSTIYIETDMGTEDNDTLLEKLSLYTNLQLTEDSMIIFSMALKREAPIQNGGLSKNFLSELLRLMNNHNQNSVFLFYEFFLLESFKGNKLTTYPDFLRCFEKFLVYTKICRALNFPESTLMTKNLIRIADNDMDIEELKYWVLIPTNLLNPYIQIYMNRKTASLVFQKYLNLLSTIFHYIKSAAWNQMSYLYHLFAGYPVYVLPTVLLSNYFPDMFLSRKQEQILVSVQSYYPMIMTGTRTTYVDALCIDELYPPVSFRNAYRVGGGLVIVSSIYNVSVLCQIMLCSSIEKSSTVKFLHFVLLVDEYEQALSIDKLLGLPAQQSEYAFVPKNAFLTVSYIKRDELGKKERFFHIYGYQDTLKQNIKREPRYSLPRIYETTTGMLHSEVLKKQHYGFYDIAGYTDFDESIRERIKNKYEEDIEAHDIHWK